MASPPNWFCAQLGGREHYAIPRALHASAALNRLMTDFWAGNCTKTLARTLPGKILRSLASRQHPDLPAETVWSCNARAMGWEVLSRRMSREGGVDGRYLGYCEIGRRFSNELIRWFSNMRHLPENSVFFGYDTCGLEVMQYLKSRSVLCILDQIDPGRVEAEMVRAEQETWPGWEDQLLEIPEEFFERHHLEWELADRVVVNSNWSRSALVQQGVAVAKISVVPLSYEVQASVGPARASGDDRGRSRVQRSFSKQSPLNVLFLGQVMLRKGVQYLAAAAETLRNEPVVFDIVGPVKLSEMAVATVPGNMRFHGRATRDQISDWYQKADVFVLPTLSDGFAITQIEAMANGLPVIATPNCGEVATDGIDGFIVPPRDPDALAAAIMRYVQDPGCLARHQYAALAKAEQFSLSRLSGALMAIAGTDGR